jgi:hypothetical protein
MGAHSEIRPSTPSAIVTRCFPSDDRAFEAAVNRLVGQLTDGDRLPESLERRLRAIYPGAAVRAQDALARFGTEPVWYVFRDGHDSSGAGKR